MVWLEYNIHIRPEFRYAYPKKVTTILLDLIKPLVKNHKSKFDHWHYLVQKDCCREGDFGEIRIRFEAERTKLDEIKNDLLDRLRKFSELIIPEEENHRSHEGEHGDRDKTYKGAESEKEFGQDWDKIVKILEIGSESALRILRYYPSLKSQKSHKEYQIIRVIDPHTRIKMTGPSPIITPHPYFLHLPANQFLVEP